MKVVIINKSDSTGGAAVVSRRLMDALRAFGVEASMLVCEKLSDSPFVHLAASSAAIRWRFMLERLKIFIANGFNRQTLFRIDTGEVGLPIWKNPLIKEADAIMINWVNQGMLSLRGVMKLASLGKPIIWTMHDMWCFTGVCHHAGECSHYLKNCGDCPLLNTKASPRDLSAKVWRRKFSLYNSSEFSKRSAFVPVSRWLHGKALQSSLLSYHYMEVIPNAFKSYPTLSKRASQHSIRIIFGAARIDDPIKGIDTLREASQILKKEYAKGTKDLELVFFGKAKNSETLENFALPVEFLGILQGEEAVAGAYSGADILVSASSYETLPGTLVEAQAYGCIPVAFNQGGQSDIIEDQVTGFIVHFDENIQTRARNLAEGVLKAIEVISDAQRLLEMKTKMKESVKQKFSYASVASRYLKLIESLQSDKNE